MAIAVADLSNRVEIPTPVSSTIIRVLIVHGCPLFRAGLRSLFEKQDDRCLIGEATQLEDVLMLAREHCPDVVLLDGSLGTTDPLDLVQQLRRLGVPGIMVFAPPTGDEETLFQFLKYGATAYEDPHITGEDLLAKMRRVALGECLITGDVLLVLAARRERLARIRRDALRAAGLIEACRPSPPVEDCEAAGNSSPLSAQERAILEQIARGGTNAQIARTLGVCPHIVKDRLDRLFKQLDIHNRTTAVVIALRKGWITVDGIPSLSL